MTNVHWGVVTRSGVVGERTIVGGTGATRSSVYIAIVVALRLPAGSMATTVNRCRPSTVNVLVTEPAQLKAAPVSTRQRVVVPVRGGEGPRHRVARTWRAGRARDRRRFRRTAIEREGADRGRPHVALRIRGADGELMDAVRRAGEVDLVRRGAGDPRSAVERAGRGAVGIDGEGPDRRRAVAGVGGRGRDERCVRCGGVERVGGGRLGSSVPRSVGGADGEHVHSVAPRRERRRERPGAREPRPRIEAALRVRPAIGRDAPDRRGHVRGRRWARDGGGARGEAIEVVAAEGRGALVSGLVGVAHRDGVNAIGGGGQVGGEGGAARRVRATVDRAARGHGVRRELDHPARGRVVAGARRWGGDGRGGGGQPIEHVGVEHGRSGVAGGVDGEDGEGVAAIGGGAEVRRERRAAGGGRPTSRASSGRWRRSRS